jgi:tetratricopeptide (TPR) repeat protein
MEEAGVEAQIDELLMMAAQAFDAGRIDVTENILVGLRALTKTHFEVNRRLGILLANKGDARGARAVLEDAVRADDSNDMVFFVLSACAYAAQDYEMALEYADRSVQLRRTFPDAHACRGNALVRLGRPAEALEALTTAQMLNPADPGVYVNLANALGALDRDADALASLERALQLNPDLAPAHLNRGDVLRRLDRISEALACYETAVALDPTSIDARWNRGVSRLLAGDYAGGWPDYECRWFRTGRDSDPRDFAQPLWLGAEDLRSRTILLHGEQGFGDCIQFARYISAVAARGARVVLEIYTPLKPLFEDFPGVAAVVARGEPLPPFELHCPLMSLPLALGAPEPLASPAPYLAAPAARRALWRERLGPKGAPRVGLVVSGSTVHGNDRHRSLTFATLAEHLPPGLEYHLLQKEIRERDHEALAARPQLRIWAEAIGDFADTAALAEEMDLVVSVDTSVAHLAGALGRPTAVLLPFEPDWRWGLGGSTTPWYADMRLYRQARRGDWREPLRRLSAELSALAEA